jgi:cation diffusion facilitator CzcD-associated flavoprotein CzcO
VKEVAAKYDLETNIKYKSKLVAAAWNEDEARWHLKVNVEGHEIDDQCDVLVNAGGVLK